MHNFAQLMHHVEYCAATGVNSQVKKSKMVEGITSSGLQVTARGWGEGGRNAEGGRVSRNQSQQCTAYLSRLVRQQEHTP